MTGKGGEKIARDHKTATQLAHAGRDPAAHHGYVNTPVYHASTMLYPSAEEYIAHRSRYQYGRRGTPTSEAFQNALKEIEGPQCEGVALLPSGLSAISTALLSVLRTGDHLLMTDSAYFPTRKLCNDILPRYGIATTYYDPADRSGHRHADPAQHPRRLCREPGIADLRDAGHSGHRRGGPRARRRRGDGQHLGEPALFPRPGEGRRPLDPVRHQIYRRPFRHHAGRGRGQCGDVAAVEGNGLRDSASASDPTTCFSACGGCVPWACGSPSTRRPASRSRDGWRRGRRWWRCSTRRCRAIPATPSGSATSPGACGLFSIVFTPAPRTAVYAFLDALTLFGIGASWGGFESLAIPFNATPIRTATKWAPAGPTVRLHIGLEDVGDLTADLARGFAAFTASLATAQAAS